MPTLLQSTLGRLLTEHAADPALSTFIDAHHSGVLPAQYLEVLCAADNTYGELMTLRGGLRRWPCAERPSVKPEVVDAIALSALVLYERHHGKGPAGRDIAAADLLMAAIQASAFAQADVVLGPGDAQAHTVANAAPQPAPFKPYVKNGADLQWLAIKRALNHFAETLLQCETEPSYEALRQTFEYHKKDIEARHPDINEDQLKAKLDHVAQQLGGRPVFYVPHDQPTEWVKDYGEKIKSTFDIAIVVWKKEREDDDAAAQVDAFLASLYQTAAPSSAVTASTPGGPKATTVGERVEAVIGVATAAANEADKIVEVAKRFSWLPAAWQFIRNVPRFFGSP